MLLHNEQLLIATQYTVTMFLVDTSPSMGSVRTVDLPDGPNGETRTTEMTNLEWALRYVKTKIQEMVWYNYFLASLS